VTTHVTEITNIAALITKPAVTVTSDAA
jgi:hypothetical protein